MMSAASGEALQEAIKIFAEHGFEGTSVDDLTEAMGMGRQSLYNKFGDKRRLYLTALQQYIDDQTHFMLSILDHPLQPSQRITALFDACVATLISQDSPRCLFACAITEFGTSDKEVLRLTKKANLTLGKALGRCIAEGQMQEDIPASHDPTALANFLIWSMAGIRMAARFSVDNSTLRSLAEIALSTVRGEAHADHLPLALKTASARSG